MSKDDLFTWIHLSDLHFGGGDARHGYDLDWLASKLIADVEAMRETVGEYDAIFVTGDIAFSGACRSDSEYTQAAAFLSRLANASGVPLDRIFTVPGNHDVQRTADQDDDIARLVNVVRFKVQNQNVDRALTRPLDRDRLTRRLANYLAFTEGFGPARPEGRSPELWWCHHLQGRRGLKIRLAGLNTALVCADDADQGRLELGQKQVNESLSGGIPDELVIALTHHPLSGGWLSDERDVGASLKNSVHIHLSGHLHDQGTVALKSAQTAWLSISAGAVHRDPKEGPGIDQTYTIGVIRARGKKVRARIWPRRWSTRLTKFTALDDEADFAKDYADYDLPRVTLPAADTSSEVDAPDDGPVLSKLAKRIAGNARPDPKKAAQLVRHSAAHFVMAVEARNEDREKSNAYLLRGTHLLSRAVTVVTTPPKVSKLLPLKRSGRSEVTGQ